MVLEQLSQLGQPMKGTAAIAVLMGLGFALSACAMRKELVVTGVDAARCISFQARGPVGTPRGDCLVGSITMQDAGLTENLEVSFDGGPRVAVRRLVELYGDTDGKWTIQENPPLPTVDFAKGDWLGLNRSDIAVYAYKGVLRQVVVFPGRPTAAVFLNGNELRLPMEVDRLIELLNAQGVNITTAEYTLTK